MARAKSKDFLHSFRFHVVMTSLGDYDLGSRGTQPAAGFSAVGIPEVSHDAVEYREGHYIYTRKHVGLPTVSDITLSRGVALRDSTFWRWMQDVIEGNSEYRGDLSIFHFHRDAKPATTSGDVVTEMPFNGPTGSIEYKCKDVFPIRYKPAGDLDATASEVSIQELDVAVESFSIEHHPQA